MAGGLDLDSPGVHVSSMTATTVNATRNGVDDPTVAADAKTANAVRSTLKVGGRAQAAVHDGASARLVTHTAEDAGGDMGEAEIASLARDLRNLRQRLRRDSDSGRGRTGAKAVAVEAAEARARAAEVDELDADADPTDLYALNVTYRYK